MKTLLKVVAAGLVGLSLSAVADPPLVMDDYGFWLVDADGIAWWVDDAHMSVIYNEGNPIYVGVAGKGQLPEEAALPDKAFTYVAQDMGFCGCIYCDDVNQFTVTPNGKVNFVCRIMAE